jgi:hypothetical protein
MGDTYVNRDRSYCRWQLWEEESIQGLLVRSRGTSEQHMERCGRLHLGCTPWETRVQQGFHSRHLTSCQESPAQHFGAILFTMTEPTGCRGPYYALMAVGDFERECRAAAISRGIEVEPGMRLPWLSGLGHVEPEAQSASLAVLEQLGALHVALGGSAAKLSEKGRRWLPVDFALPKA